MEWMKSDTAGHETHGQSAVYDCDTAKDVCIVYDGDKHAALIAAAPDMLAALIRARNVINYLVVTGKKDVEDDFQIIRAAIARASGEV